MDKLAQIIQEIKALKIQGATNIGKSALETLLSLPEEQIPEAIQDLISTRPTEPLLQNCLNLVNLKGKSVIRPTLERIEDTQKEIIKNGLSLIKDGTSILTHCHSSTVIELLKRARQKGINFKVYLTETRPAFQGRITARELVAAGISSIMVTDSEAAFLVSREDERKIDLVIFGSDAITPDGGAINKVGSYGIALSARQAKVPLYIAATLLKFSPQEVVIEERGGEEIWKKKPRNLVILNPSFDLIPPELITSYISEFGQIKPEKIKATVKKNYSWIFQKTKDKRQKTGTPYKSYLHLGEKVDPKTHTIASFSLRVEKGSDFEEVAGGIAAESSVGTWTRVETEIKEVFDRLHARVLTLDKKTGFLQIAYPLELFEEANLPQLLSSVVGNIFGLKEVANLKLLDLILPEKYVQSFAGPALGSSGIRKLTGIFSRPLIGCIVKPKLGLDPECQAKVVREVFEGGVDFVKDDENLTSQVFNPFQKRVKEIIKVIKEAKFKKKIYAFNITAEARKMEERAEFVKSQGGNCVMIDFLTTGFAGLQSLRNKNYDLIIHGHRAMHAAFNRIPNHGISMLVLSKLARLAGVDSLHTGTVVGKMEGEASEVTKINKFLLGEWYGIKPVLPVASGGLHPGLVPQAVKILGKEVLLNFGGGIHGHPKGSKAGATACLQAVEATQRRIPLLEYAKTHEELAIALEHWGAERPKGEE